MNSILSTLRNMFGKDKKDLSMESRPASVDMTPPMDEIVPSKADHVLTESATNAENFSEQPQKRMIIQPPVIANEDTAPDTDKVLIKAQPSVTLDQCKFMVNRSLLRGKSWYFPDFESAEGSPLAEALFSVDGVETALVHESTVTLTRTDKSSADWRPLAKEAGIAIRKKLQSEDELISEKILQAIPAEEDVRNKIQEVIDLEVNPGVAGHGGRITLTKVEGNSVTIQMGGGCQGCSAADLTLKQGIHNSFRKALPVVGAIYDETDHKSGLNPYYS